MSHNNGHFIKPCKNGSEVILDPGILLGHALYMPDGETVVRSNMTLGQAVEAIAFAHIKTRMPHLAEKCNAAKIEFKDGNFIVSFADSIDNLQF